MFPVVVKTVRFARVRHPEAPKFVAVLYSNGTAACECAGFGHYGRCKHTIDLLSRRES